MLFSSSLTDRRFISFPLTREPLRRNQPVPGKVCSLQQRSWEPQHWLRLILPHERRVMTEDFLSAPPESPLVISERSVTVLKQPVWIWSVPVYFYLGSTAGTAAALAFAAQTADAYRFSNVISKARGICACASLLGSVLLVQDLGRPSRFLNMLRVLKLSSPMSVGSWLLATTTPLVMLAAAFSNTSGRVLHRIGSLSG